MWLMMDCPLTANPDIDELISDEMYEVFDRDEVPPISPEGLFYHLTSTHLFDTPCKWLSIYPYKMMARMLRTEGMVADADNLDAVRHTGAREFECKGQDERILLLHNAENNQEYRLCLDSFYEPVETDRPYLIADLVSFDGKEWLINGSSWFAVTPREKPTTITDGDRAYEFNLKKLDGRRIGYFKNFEDMHKQITGNLPVDDPYGKYKDLEDSGPILVFLNSDGSLSISSELASTIPDPDNPYFKKVNNGLMIGAATEESLASADLARYIHQQGWFDGVGLTSSISPERGVALFQDNFDFLMRYFRLAEYHTKATDPS